MRGRRAEFSSEMAVIARVFDLLQEYGVLVLDERHQVHVVSATDNEDASTGKTVAVGMFPDVDEIKSPRPP
jgi:hypothetical protein